MYSSEKRYFGEKQPIELVIGEGYTGEVSRLHNVTVWFAYF